MKIPETNRKLKQTKYDNKTTAPNQPTSCKSKNPVNPDSDKNTLYTGKMNSIDNQPLKWLNT